ncbi:MAG: dihydrofolate reductase [Brumimicrobium sp.]|nr:dihydrofolate reductase [Brumimicrobium sp.]
MKKIILNTLAAGILFSCSGNKDTQITEQQTENQMEQEETTFEYKADRFADIQVLRYKIKDWDKLSIQQKELAYYLVQAGLAGRDIIYDQNYKYNLEIRNALENIVQNYQGEKNDDWDNFMTYVKQVWFANGIHHHYSMDKFLPKFNKEYFNSLLLATNTTISNEALIAIFDPKVDAKRVNLDASKGLIPGSANNFYGSGITDKMVDDYYEKVIDKNDPRPISYGLNSKMVLNNGQIEELPWKIGGMYGPALEKVVYWLEKATLVAENDAQRKALEILIEYYKTGDLKLWDTYSIAWCEATKGDIDYINGFIEVYGDAKGYRANYETIVQMKDFEATETMGVLAHEAQWFEDNSPIMNEHKKKNVTGVTYNVVTVIGEAGDASPSTPIGVNLPNAEWIREEHGSKSVSLGNLIDAYNEASGPSILEEFTYSQEEVERAKKYGHIGDNLHTALHEVIGHASGQINPGIGTPKETLGSYASALEEARADLVGLYYLMDQKLVDLKLMESLETGKAEYDNYIRNGLMTQLRRLELGKDIEEAHMRNRQLVAAWAFEKGKTKNVIEKLVKDGKTYFKINDYEALRGLFGDLLREIQRIKSEGDFKAGRDLIENYGVKVDRKLHQEVLDRTSHLDIAPYMGFINPELVPVTDKDGNITDIKIEYPKSFEEQMLRYSKNYSYLK